MTSSDGTNFLRQVLDHRPYLMGVAILLVLVFHFGCWVYNPVGRLNLGYVGVDIFLFLSGLGLSLSFEKNTLGQFYKNRFLRIYPVYFFAVTLSFFFEDWSPQQLLNNYLAIGFYTDGGAYRYDWYLESLFTFYILFPLFFYWGKLNYYALAISFAGSFMVLFSFPDFFQESWWYNCFISRIPIFLYGVMFRRCLHTLPLIALLGILFYFPVYWNASIFLASSSLALPLIYLSLRALPHLPSNVGRWVEFCGRHSLELYCANCLVQIVMDLYIPNPMHRFLPYWLLQALFSFLFIGINRAAQRMLK